ncbi:probable inactive poly [ADP-ribose] polymerase SRO2 [Argentina anserina]|uniref:probable inactive poly [ADP-ribose] polymerase SRO2 n=1 Tax=Argentina anserina TaxID=57926 RepID=UPI0021764CEA|nr:probable inactive poly [ADP-ribose] polymerase SRO2 [Potentilla anserina]
MAQISEYQAPMIVDDDEKSHDGSDHSDDSSSSSSSSDPYKVFSDMSLLRLEEDKDDTVYEITKKMFSVGMNSAGVDAEVVAIHKNMHSGCTRRTRRDVFLIYQRTVAQKCGGNANIAHGWYGGSKEEICDIVLHGFSGGREPGFHGVQLFANKFSFDGAMCSEPDENGLRHMLMCRVILGKRELVLPGWRQVSSEEFDSGVDSLMNPKKYIIGSSLMNFHIMPMFVVSFKAPTNLKDIPKNVQASAAIRQPPPRSTWVSLNTVMDALAKVLSPPKMVLLSKSADDFRAKKITRAQIIRRIRTLAGDKLMVSVVQNFKKERE